LEDEYVHYLDAMPDIKKFMEELKAKEALLPERKVRSEEEEEEKKKIKEKEKGDKKEELSKY
jgi:hypothetical protein